MDLKGASKLDDQPPLHKIEENFKYPQKFAIAGSIGLSIILLIAWPAFASLGGVLSLAQFYIWVVISLAWGVLAGVFILVVPVYGEIKAAIDTVKEKTNKMNVDFELQEVF